MHRSSEPPRDPTGPRPTDADTPAPPPRPYSPPTLIVYGRADELTHNVGTRGRKDARRGSRRTGF